MLDLQVGSDRRRLVVKAIIDLLRTVCHAYFDDYRIGDHSTEITVGLALVLGQSEGRPMTASDIAEYTGTSRTTVLRIIKAMEERGAVGRKRSGRRVVFWLLRVNLDTVVSEVTKSVKIIHRVSAELSELVKSTSELSGRESSNLKSTLRRQSVAK